jgi:hypothetical protein
MKKVLFFMLFLMISGAAGVNAQVRIGGDGAPHTAAVLDLNATDTTINGNRGLALPRVSLTTATIQLNGANPKDGTLVYNTNSGFGAGLYYWLTDKWVKLQLNGEFQEKDSVIGNEVLNATASRGLVRAGSGTSASPYTLGISDNGVTAAMINNGAVTAAKLAAGAVYDGDSIVGNEVTNATTSGGLTRAGSGTSAAPYTLGIADAGVTTARIADNAVTTAKIAASAVTSAKIADGTVVTADLADNSVTSAKIVDATIVAADIANTTITGAKLVNATVTATQLADNAVTTAKIAASAVTSAKLADKAVTYAKIDNTSASSGQVLKYNGTAWAPAAGGIDGVANGLTKSGVNAELGGTLTKATAIAQAGFNLYTTGDGKVSIGAAPNANSAKFEVSGAATNTAAYSAGSGRTVDFSQSNLAYTTASAGAFTLNNLKNGGAYTLAVQGTTSGTSSFTASNTAGTALTVKILNSMATVSGKQTLYTILVMGTTAYVFVNSGF